MNRLIQVAVAFMLLTLIDFMVTPSPAIALMFIASSAVFWQLCILDANHLLKKRLEEQTFDKRIGDLELKMSAIAIQAGINF